MKQQVNLYHSRFGAKPRLLSARQIVWIGGLCAAFLGLLFGVEQLRTRDEAHALEALREGSADAADGIVRLAETHPPARANPGLQEEVERRTSEREVKSELLRLLSSHSLGNAGGFSPYLAALARRRVNGLWLTEIRLTRGGRELRLAGSALEPDLVPRLIEDLQEEEAFEGTKFRQFCMERAPDDGGRVDFSLDTNGEAEP
jgi:hypothetical protein